MIDIKFLRENPEIVKQNIKNKFQDHKLPLVDEEGRLRGLVTIKDIEKRLKYPNAAKRTTTTAEHSAQPTAISSILRFTSESSFIILPYLYKIKYTIKYSLAANEIRTPQVKFICYQSASSLNIA